MINLMESLQIVKQIFASAKTKNPKMTLRFAATKMKISYGRLSELLNGKRVISDCML